MNIRQADQLLDQGVLEPPQYDTANRKPSRLTDQIRALIIDYIDANERKRSELKHKQQMTAKDMHAHIVAAGHKIGYTTVSTFVTATVKKRIERFIRKLCKTYRLT